MPKVYLTAASQQNAQTAKLNPWQQSSMLGQNQHLPYFRAFEQPLLNFNQLCTYLEQHIDKVLTQRGWQADTLQNTPILLGSTAYLMSDCEFRWHNNQPLPQEYSLALIAERLKTRYQTSVFSVATSCTSSAQAIGYAYQMIEQGQCERALVVGFEMFNRLTFEHFNAMHLLADDLPYQPFEQHNGIILGEGIACVALENQPNPEKKLEISAITTITDHHNLTNSSAEALTQLIENCLHKAGLQSHQLAGIKVHAVGGNSDEMEIAFLQQQFPSIPCLLAKPYLGHSLGASGAMETAWLWQQLQQDKTNYLTITPQGAIEKQTQPLSTGYYLNYFLGFGGSNIAWILHWQGKE
ncbi:beta-ketoacyl synthase [Avibacterium sp. 20-15]|uniref:beta-ketoacyl synthase N-terminal-like domain-containing protein n=1 Tax=unclassified Avibacterium TaxID=2685287 RepID=UPI002026BA0C|nr:MULTISPECIES: beta-ketoacyl synthase N-terminal-like domain-containing protein [unclassified Avibacterium]MCW9732710.1 beta-ketoacyl synthase [Avibacterium sp. 20-15]URL04857.1 beta-ketoacyl synthase [Avibacterium sp. 20-132]